MKLLLSLVALLFTLCSFNANTATAMGMGMGMDCQLGPCMQVPGFGDMSEPGSGPILTGPSGGEMGGGPRGLPKPWPKTMCKATISCWSASSAGHTCEVAGNYLTADEAYLKLQQINCCKGTSGGGRPNGYNQWKGCGVF